MIGGLPPFVITQSGKTRRKDLIVTDVGQDLAGTTIYLSTRSPRSGRSCRYLHLLLLCTFDGAVSIGRGHRLDISIPFAKFFVHVPWCLCRLFTAAGMRAFHGEAVLLFLRRCGTAATLPNEQVSPVFGLR